MQASLFVLESLAHNRFVQDMERLQRRRCRPGSYFPLLDQFREAMDFYLPLPSAREFRLSGLHLFELLMKERWEKKELRVPKAKPISPFRDAAFAQENGLFAAA